MSNFIQDFLAYNCGTECHVNYLRWSALATIAVASGPRYFVQQGRIRVYTNDYFALIGSPGVKKTYAKDQTRDLISEALPDHPIGADLMSRDALINYMASEDTEREYIDFEGVSKTYHPTTLFINELKHLLSYTPGATISCFVDLYDRCDRPWTGLTIRRGKEFIERPCLNIIACENTDWFVRNLKNDLLTGGFARRFTVVYEPDDSTLKIALPYLPDNHVTLWDSLKKKLINISNNSHQFQWTPDGLTFFKEWYKQHWATMPDDKILRGFLRTKDQKLLKTAMWLDLAEDKPTYIITPSLLEESLFFFNQIEPNMPKLYMAAGRNELALPQQGILDLLELNEGILQDRELLRKIDKDFTPDEKTKVLKNLQQLGSLVKAEVKFNGKQQGVYFLNGRGLADLKDKGISYRVFPAF